jgi:hypothetical protein
LTLPPLTLVGRLQAPAVHTTTARAHKAEAVLLVWRPGYPEPWPLEAWGSDADRLEAAPAGQLVGVIGTIATTGQTDPGQPSWVLLAQRLELLPSPPALEA